MGKSPISMAIFSSFLYVHQNVTWPTMKPCRHRHLSGDSRWSKTQSLQLMGYFAQVFSNLSVELEGWHVLATTKGHLEVSFSDMIVNFFLSSWISVCGGWSKFFRLQTAILREYKSYFCESLRIVYQYFLILMSCICFSDATRFCEMKMRVTCKPLLI